MASEGSQHGRFARAIDRRQARNAEMVAREMGQLSLADALALVALYGITDDAKLEQAAIKLLGRLAHERSGPRRTPARSRGAS